MSDHAASQGSVIAEDPSTYLEFFIFSDNSFADRKNPSVHHWSGPRRPAPKRHPGRNRAFAWHSNPPELAGGAGRKLALGTVVVTPRPQ